jgi:hypothetical protein
MIGFLIRLMLSGRVPRVGVGWLFRGGSALDFWLGMAMYLVGLGLTVARFLTTYTVGGFFNVLLYLVTIGGIVRMMSSAHAVLRVAGGRRYGPPGKSLPIIPSFVAPPSEMPPGLCWQCGGTVKPDRFICLHCGASLPAIEQAPSEMAQLVGFDGAPSSMATSRHMRAVAGPPPSRGMPPGTYRQGPPDRDMPPGGPPPGWAPGRPRG